MIKTLAAGHDWTELLERVESGEFDPGEFADLSCPERRTLIMLLQMQGHWSQSALSRLTGRSRRTVQKDQKAIRKALGEAVDLEGLVGDLVLVADRLAKLALDQGDVATAWKITKERVELLIRLGYVRPELREKTHGLTAEALGKGYERARAALAKLLEPDAHVLTGQVIEQSNP